MKVGKYIRWECMPCGMCHKSLWYDGGNSLSLTFRCADGIRQGGQLSSHCCVSIYRWPNHHLQATGVGCYVGGTWVNSLTHADDMVLLVPTVTAHQTLLEVCRAYGEPQDIVYNTTKTVCMLVRPKQSQGWFSTRVRLGNVSLSFIKELVTHSSVLLTSPDTSARLWHLRWT